MRMVAIERILSIVPRQTHGKPKRIEPSNLTKNPPANCWHSCKRTPRRYEKGAHMNLRNALRYIYIYRLNLAKAGWEHDLQPREKWRTETRAKRRSGLLKLRCIQCSLHARRNSECYTPAQQKNDSCGRGKYARDTKRLRQFGIELQRSRSRDLSSECLTPKGVTA